jgi:hypothetical protein
MRPPVGLVPETPSAASISTRRRVAFFRQGTSEFALIPGGPVILGYEASRPWQPDPDELETWQDYDDGWFKPGQTIQECIAEVTLRPHRVEFSPFLIEKTAGEIGWEPIGLDDPIVQQMLGVLGACSEYERAHEGGETRVRRGDDGSIQAERFLNWTHADLAERLAIAGFRFPTSDEWEYACGAGAPTLFKWGDHVPREWWTYPYDWDLYLQPNPFGISIATDCAKFELVAEIGTTRGGDGGDSGHGGAGAFITWLRYATAYFEESYCRHDSAKPITTGFTIGRRVLALP